MDANEIQLTAEGRQRLVEELEWREGEKSKEIRDALRTARSFGDLSENAEYDAALEEQSKNAGRIAEINAILASAKVVADEEVELIVSIDSTVTLVDADGVATDFTIKGTTETNSLKHIISNESPVGRAVIGRGEGETVEVVLPSGKKRIYTIARIVR